MSKIFRFFLVACMPVTFLFFSSCLKDKLGDGPVTFSNDTLTFDTVFTTLGSTTQDFKVFNNGKRTVKFDNIQLVNPSGNQFRINVDGIPGTSFSNVEIPGKDSIYVFVEVTVDPSNKTTPFVIIGQVNFTMGGKTQSVYLQAFGQNAHFHYGEEILTGHSETWTNDLPHVILSYDSIPGVLVDCGATLKIQPGCQIYIAANSAIYVAGTFYAVASNWQDSILFRGVRLESYYQDLPGQWLGVVFLRNGSCVPVGHFSHCVLNESTYGIYAGAGTSSEISSYQNSPGPIVTVDKTVVKNCQDNAIYGFNANITATNSLFYTAGGNLIELGLGGNYSFTNCTMYNIGSVSVSHQSPSLLLSNFAVDANNNVYPAPLTTSFTNCIIYGSLTDEIAFSNIDSPSLARFNNSFSYSLLQSSYVNNLSAVMATYVGNIFNQPPLFVNPTGENFTPSDTTGYFSVAIDVCPSGPSKDLYDNPRPISLTSNPNKYDIGAIERQ